MSNPITTSQPADEADVQAALADTLRANGWVAIREYQPDDADRRVDIFAEHDDYGAVGIETKYIRRDRDGRRLAEAFLQVERDYSRRKYNGSEVALWAIAPFFAPGNLAGTTDDRRLMDFARSFITRVGIGVLDCHARTLKIQYDTDRADTTIPVAGPYADTYAARLDLPALRDLVATRRSERE
jgi:hypothetical protein